jgi:hypothetical protein
MAQSTLAGIEEIRALARELEPHLPAPELQEQLPEDDPNSWLSNFCGGLGCLVRDRLLPTFRELCELSTRDFGEQQGLSPDVDALWQRLRPDRRDPAEPSPQGEEKPGGGGAQTRRST